ncbi:phage terminase large subunit [Sneathiella chinensis]|nr:phage terminase large subunit [Sneathiella chinensis]
MAEIRPQPGPQEAFLSSAADIAIYGGAAGGGKSFALLLEPLRHVGIGGFRSVLFRRTGKQIRNEGGLWDASRELYGKTGAAARETDLSWRFASGAAISFGYMEHEKNRYDWQGTEITCIGFDELTHFTESQFFYMLSRNRSTCGVRPYVRATCNPDADSWVARFIDWWIDPQTGYPIKDRSGVVRWFVRDEDALVWADGEAELTQRFPGAVPKSVTFIAANIEDNRILLERDRGYRANLAALDRVERERLLLGNWKIRPAAGEYFRRGWFRIVDRPPADIQRSARGWDLAASEGGQGDWTVGARVGRTESGGYVIEHVERLRASPGGVEGTIQALATQDGARVAIALPQDPGQAGKAQAKRFVALLAGYRVRARPVSGDKVTRAAPFSAQVEAGNVVLVNGLWNEAFLRELENFPGGRHDDQVDAVVEAFNALQETRQTMQKDMYT